MTYYSVKNLLENGTEYFVPDQATKDANTHIFCIVGTQQDAEAKAQANKNAYLEHQSFRFSIAKEVVNGNDTTWCAADLQNDSEEGTYHVFNHVTGQYEIKNFLSEAIARMEQLKTEFINEIDWSVSVVDTLPNPPTPYPANTYGLTVGDIPVEVM